MIASTEKNREQLERLSRQRFYPHRQRIGKAFPKFWNMLMTMPASRDWRKRSGKDDVAEKYFEALPQLEKCFRSLHRLHARQRMPMAAG